MKAQHPRHVDVIVVASRFGGAVCAARLAEQGMRVLILEQGPWWGPLHRHRSAADQRDFPRGVLGVLGVLGVRKLLRSLRSTRNGKRRE